MARKDILRAPTEVYALDNSASDISARWMPWIANPGTLEEPAAACRHVPVGLLQGCLTTTDPVALRRILEQFEQVSITVAEPPRWLTSWGDHVVNQPLRAAVDPRALGAACTLRVAAAMVEIQRLPEAQALYQRVLTQYQDPEMAYYRNHAKDNLTMLSRPSLPLLALRPPLVPSR